ncbi:MAG TPA: NADH-quinone oxidoreductase subunit N [Chryseosolibacter sp.]
MQSLNEQLAGVTESLAFIIPELILTCGLVVVLFAGLFNNKNSLLFSILTILASVSSMAFIIEGELNTHFVLFNNMLQREGFGEFLMILVDVSVVLTCLMSIKSEKSFLSEYYSLILSIAVGSHLLLMSTNLVMVFLSLELISISAYILAGYAFNKAGSEGTLKYFLYGSIASALMLYGFSILYGLTGTLDFTSPEFSNRLIAQSSPLVLIAGFMGMAGFLFKMAAVPMQAWAPDVYEAAPIPVMAFLSVGPKLAAIGILVKFLLAMNLYGQSEFDWQLMVAAISILTITIGNFSALWQTDPKRMMAYSSIAQSGFLLVGVAGFLPQGIQFMLFYAGVYLLMNFAVFAYLMYFETQGIFSIQSFSGKGRSLIWASVGITVGLIALTGLPPTAGFTAKVLIFSSLWDAYEATHKTLLIWLLVFGLLNTVVSLFFYLRIPYYAFLRPGESAEIQKKRGFENFLGLILVVLVVVIFFVPGLLMGLINRINFVL